MITLSVIILVINVYVIFRLIPRLLERQAQIDSSIGLRRLQVGVRLLNIGAAILVGYHLLVLALHLDNVNPWVHPLWILLLTGVFFGLEVPDKLRSLEIELRAREEAPNIEYRP